MKICKHCYKELGSENGINYPPVNYHTCTPKYSDCCGVGVFIVGGRYRHDPDLGGEFKVQRGKTYHYECKGCMMPCNLSYER